MTKADSVPAAGPAFGPRALSWLPAAAFMGVIFWLSSLPGDRIPLPDFRFGDKLVHFLAYSALGILIGARKPLRARLETGIRAAPALAAFDFRGAAAGIAYGLSDEIHQLFVPLRLFSWADFAADALGVAAGLSGLWLWGRWRRPRRRS